MEKFRPVAVPLVTNDPSFSLWSMADHLYDESTRHWTCKRQAMTGLITIDGTLRRFMGKVNLDDRFYFPEPAPMRQVSLKVGATTTTYRFAEGGVELEATFLTPAFPDDLMRMARPLTYIRFRLHATDGKSHQVKLWLDASAAFCVDDDASKVRLEKQESPLYDDLFCGTEDQRILNKAGDLIRIDWGTFHFVCPKAYGFDTFFGNVNTRKHFCRTGQVVKTDIDLSQTYDCLGCPPFMIANKELTVTPQGEECMICVAYDDVKSIEYFGEQLEGYWTKDGMTFNEMLADSVSTADAMYQKAEQFDAELDAQARAAGGSRYADLLNLTYRQCIGAHKLVNHAGKLLFVSKECCSNGCAATVDVSFPSIPLPAYVNPELLLGLIRPIYDFARKDAWVYDFAPHDVGTFPLLNGQVYGMESADGQMPVEESADMIIMTALAVYLSGQKEFLQENWDLLKQWVVYLERHALDPENQLCTDDFTGHLAHNVNLSAKGIIGLGVFSKLCRMLGDEQEGDRFYALAKEYAAKWKENARTDDHFRIAYDQPDSWSIKYNLVWDRLFGLNLFDQEVYDLETSFYLTKLNRYGVPLDCRHDYTKVDWLMWVACLSDDPAYFAKINDSIWNFANESNDRFVFTDWYDTLSGQQMNFMNRTVIGALFIKLLKESGRLEGFANL